MNIIRMCGTHTWIFHQFFSLLAFHECGNFAHRTFSKNPLGVCICQYGPNSFQKLNELVSNGTWLRNIGTIEPSWNPSFRKSVMIYQSEIKCPSIVRPRRLGITLHLYLRVLFKLDKKIHIDDMVVEGRDLGTCLPSCKEGKTLCSVLMFVYCQYFGYKSLLLLWSPYYHYYYIILFKHFMVFLTRVTQADL